MNCLLKTLSIVVTLLLCQSVDVSAQKWLDKLQKGLDKTTEVNNTVSYADSLANDSIPTPEQFFKDLPNYTLKKVVMTDANANPIKNEDGIVQSKILVLDKNGNVCDRNVAKRHLDSALKQCALLVVKNASHIETNIGR